MKFLQNIFKSGKDKEYQAIYDLMDEAKRPLAREYEALSIRLTELSKRPGSDTVPEMYQIGERLYSEGGMDLRRLVNYRVRALGGEARTVERIWDGIGPWRG